MANDQTTAEPWTHCPACGRARGTGCGRDDQTPRVGCYLLGGPPPDNQTPPSQTTPKGRRNMRWGWAYYEPELGWRLSFTFIPHAERMTVSLFKALHSDGFVHEPEFAE